MNLLNFNASTSGTSNIDDVNVSSLLGSLSLPAPPTDISNSIGFPPSSDLDAAVASYIPPSVPISDVPESPPREKKKKVRVKKIRDPSFDATKVDNFTPQFDDLGHAKVQFTVSYSPRSPRVFIMLYLLSVSRFCLDSVAYARISQICVYISPP